MSDNTMLAGIKRFLKITWDDIETDVELSEMIADAKAALDHKLGADIDYSAPGLERTLFKNYILYMQNNCVNDFDNAYKSEILTLRHKYEIAGGEPDAEE